jgi:hypothetical protein
MPAPDFPVLHTIGGTGKEEEVCTVAIAAAAAMQAVLVDMDTIMAVILDVPLLYSSSYYSSC